ncbi:hypothetical protein SKAU_G00321740 [Synaphobranchus kaupii]|uniref:Uncharacterized protein n=1 Tax=Synaphobranchus kaupii TaxID=118154 RepID=A0A9Q1ENZ0_SYNKA|nr:hypothetical protein SKAU_G00321740 [Synaphobranchus kaupii]
MVDPDSCKSSSDNNGLSGQASTHSNSWSRKRDPFPPSPASRIQSPAAPGAAGLAGRPVHVPRHLASPKVRSGSLKERRRDGRKFMSPDEPLSHPGARGSLAKPTVSAWFGSAHGNEGTPWDGTQARIRQTLDSTKGTMFWNSHGTLRARRRGNSAVKPHPYSRQEGGGTAALLSSGAEGS